MSKNDSKSNKIYKIKIISLSDKDLKPDVEADIWLRLKKLLHYLLF